jgi:hypothetical protein
MQITDETPITFLTVKQLKEIINETQKNTESTHVQADAADEYVYGMRGLRDLFKCSHTKAWKLKMSVLKPAIIQHGRKFQISKKTALKLVAES